MLAGQKKNASDAARRLPNRKAAPLQGLDHLSADGAGRANDRHMQITVHKLYKKGNYYMSTARAVSNHDGGVHTQGASGNNCK